MSEEKWLRDLVRVAKDEKESEAARLDARWDRLSARELSAEEEGELRALAASSEGAEEAYELFRPFSAEVQARMLRALDEQEAASRPEEVPAPAVPPVRVAPEDRRILPFPRPPLRYVGWVSGAGLAAAALVLLLRVPAPPSGPFPSYEDHHLEGKMRAERGGALEAGGIPVFGAGSEIRLLLTPPSRLERVAADCYFVRPNEPNETQPCPEGVLQVDPESGRVEVQGTVGTQVHLAAGDWRLCVIVGRRGQLPERRAEVCGLEPAQAPPGATYWVVQKPLRIAASNV